VLNTPPMKSRRSRSAPRHIVNSRRCSTKACRPGSTGKISATVSSPRDPHAPVQSAVEQFKVKEALARRDSFPASTCRPFSCTTAVCTRPSTSIPPGQGSRMPVPVVRPLSKSAGTALSACVRSGRGRPNEDHACTLSRARTSSRTRPRTDGTPPLGPPLRLIVPLADHPPGLLRMTDPLPGVPPPDRHPPPRLHRARPTPSKNNSSRPDTPMTPTRQSVATAAFS